MGGCPAAALKKDPWEPDFKLFRSTSYIKAMSAIPAIPELVFPFTGTPELFLIAAELRSPRMYTRTLIICQSIITSIYLAIGIVEYYFARSYVAPPALGFAGPLLKRV
jgi:amino acid permease